MLTPLEKDGERTPLNFSFRNIKMDVLDVEKNIVLSW